MRGGSRRNSQMETHHGDEAESPARTAPAYFPKNSSGDRFPHTSKNSYRRLPNLRSRSQRPRVCAEDPQERLLEFHRREIAQR